MLYMVDGIEAGKGFTIVLLGIVVDALIGIISATLGGIIFGSIK